jgi:hypothetical protein
VNRDEAIALVQRIMDVDYADDDEVGTLLESLDRAFRCPSGYVSELIFWPPGNKELTATEVIEHAEAYRPIAL